MTSKLKPLSMTFPLISTFIHLHFNLFNKYGTPTTGLGTIVCSGDMVIKIDEMCSYEDNKQINE